MRVLPDDGPHGGELGGGGSGPGEQLLHLGHVGDQVAPARRVVTSLGQTHLALANLHKYH